MEEQDDEMIISEIKKAVVIRRGKVTTEDPCRGCICVTHYGLASAFCEDVDNGDGEDLLVNGYPNHATKLPLAFDEVDDDAKEKGTNIGIDDNVR